jgi:hypothetical protein
MKQQYFYELVMAECYTTNRNTLNKEIQEYVVMQIQVAES